MTDKPKSTAAPGTAAAATPGAIVFNVMFKPEDRDLFERGVVALERSEQHLAILAAKLMNAGEG